MGKEERIIYKLSADKEPFEQFEQFKRNHKVFQQESPSKFNMGNPNKDSDGATGNLTSPWDPTRQPEISARERSQGCCPSQASSGGHSKTDGQGSHALPEKTKISYFHHWIDSEGMAKIESWKNKKILISQEDYEKLEENEKEGKYSSEKIEVTSHSLNLC